VSQVIHENPAAGPDDKIMGVLRGSAWTCLRSATRNVSSAQYGNPCAGLRSGGFGWLRRNADSQKCPYKNETSHHFAFLTNAPRI
jgi:hypothetical protein